MCAGHAKRPRVAVVQAILLAIWAKASIRMRSDPSTSIQANSANAGSWGDQRAHVSVVVCLARKALQALACILTFAVLEVPTLAAPVELWIVAAGDLRGEIKPCGCVPGEELGGLARRLTYLEHRRQQYGTRLITVDLGNNLAPPTAQGLLKAELILAVLERTQLDAILPGPLDLALGARRVELSLPYVLSNAAEPGPLAPIRVVEREGRRVGVLGYLGPEEIFQGAQSDLRLERPGAALLGRWRALLDQHRIDLAVLLFRGSNAHLAPLLKSSLFDAIVTGNPSADESRQITQRVVGETIVPQVPTKGQGMLRWALAPGHPNAEVNVDWLDGTYADHKYVAKAMTSYDARVKSLFLQQAEEEKARRTASPYAGAEACKGCHAKAYSVWARSRHARALAALKKVGKSFDPDCLTCHVTGLGHGGYISEESTARLGGVQCEMCHGPAKVHATRPFVKPRQPAVPSQDRQTHQFACDTCHHGSHSPRFAFSAYWPRIEHR